MARARALGVAVPGAVEGGRGDSDRAANVPRWIDATRQAVDGAPLLARHRQVEASYTEEGRGGETDNRLITDRRQAPMGDGSGARLLPHPARRGIEVTIGGSRRDWPRLGSGTSSSPQREPRSTAARSLPCTREATLVHHGSEQTSGLDRLGSFDRLEEEGRLATVFGAW